jgi:hypothetical protein
MAGMKEKIKPALIVIAVLLIAYCAWYSYDRFFSYAGVPNSFTIEVQNVEVSERLASTPPSGPATPTATGPSGTSWMDATTWSRELYTG